MDWVTTIRKEAQTSSILRTDELARKYDIGPPSVTQALSRLERKGFVEHVNDKTYYNWLAPDGSPRDLVNVLRGDAYISLESALRDYGISTQSPHTLTCVTTERPDEFRSRTITISYRSISPRLYWGFKRKTTRYGSYLIAEPEKTILDWIYLGIRNGTAPALDELDFTNVNRPKLLEYARRFSSSVYQHVLPALVDDSDRAKRPPLSEPAAAGQELTRGDRVEGLGNFGKPTGEIGTVERANEEDAVVKWDDDGRTRLHQPSLKKI